MTRWFPTVTALAVLAAPAVAQLNTKTPGYVVIRVKLAGEGDTSITPGGTSGEGDTGGGPGPGGGRGYGQGGRPGPADPGGTGGRGYGQSGGDRQPPGGLGGGVGGGLGGPPGIPGGLGGPSLPGSNATNPAPVERSVHVLVPYSRLLLRQPLYKEKRPNELTNPEFVAINHAFGTSILYPNKVNVQVEFLAVTTEESRLKDAYTRWSADANRKPAVLLAYIGDALKAELLPLAEQFSDSLANQFEKDKELPADVASFIKGYKDLKAKWNEPAAANPVAETWKAKFGAEANIFTDQPHYAVVHFSGDALTGQSGDSVIHAADLLEKNLKSFYLWHLREGSPLPLPEKRLIAVVSKNGSQLTRLKEGLDGMPVSSDSFYSPAHNLLVLSPERTDELGRSFNAIAATKLEGFDRNELLHGKHPNLKGQQKPDDIATASTYALIRRALEDEALRSAISREGTRQLFVTLGVMPQHVRLPKWIESGMGSVLQHPKGGGVVELSKDTPGIVVGTSTGHGAANYDQLYHFLRYFPAKKDGKENKSIDSSAVLTNVLTDKYFAAVALGADPDRPASLTDLLPAIRPSGGNGPNAPSGITPAAPSLPGGTPGGGVPAPPTPPGRPGRGSPDTDAQGPPPPPPPPPPGGQGSGGSAGGLGTIGRPGGDDTGIIDSSATNPMLSSAELDQKARASAWALTFYLTKNGKMPKLHAYLTKLNELPRDMRVSPEVSLKLFCETFGLMKPNSQEIDRGAFNTFAKDWMAFMHQQTPTYQTVTLKKLNGENQNQQGPGGVPGVPGSPGGLGGPGAPGGLGGPGGPGGRGGRGPGG